jgi:hypothetical protein
MNRQSTTLARTMMRHPKARSAVTNGTHMLVGIDGRSPNARRFRDICANYEAEAGGSITEVERDLIRQAAGLTLRAEQMQAAIVRGEPVSNDELVRISSTARRLLESIRSKADKRKPAGPDLASYLAATYPKADAEPADDEPEPTEE